VSSTLKIGQTYSKLKDHEKARMMYERIVDQYPDSPEAELARKAIEADADRTEPFPKTTDDAVSSLGETTPTSFESDATMVTPNR